ncbi:MAG: hypothetical protein VX087_00280 [Pseudomonadota bacterium]|nr:hypothetical protein [Pseudomonadota bacterium]
MLSIYKFYSSNKNINSTKFNRNNIQKILNEKISDLPILDNDTNDVIILNNSINKGLQREKKRSFWELFKTK